MFLLTLKSLLCSKHNDCWHACIRMLYDYRGKMPVIGSTLQSMYSNDTGLPSDKLTLLQTEGGLRPVPLTTSPKLTTGEMLEGMLKTYGPILMAMYYDYGAHIVALWGVDGTGTTAKIHFNDPNQFHRPVGPQARDIDWFYKRVPADLLNPFYYLPV